VWVVNLLFRLFGLSWRIGTEVSKDKTIEKQQQEIVDLNVENVEQEAEQVEQEIKNEYEQDKAKAGDDLDARLDNINKHNP
jgi:hypothetical protein